MEVLQRQEEDLKTKLEDAATIVERRQIRSELREVRNKMANFALIKDENANIVETKNDINANNILPKKEIKSLQLDSKIIDREPKISTESMEKKKESEFRVSDDAEQLRAKTADERANRRARRQERMAKLAKEQTDDSTRNEASDDVADRNRRREREETSIKTTSNGLKSDKSDDTVINRKENRESSDTSKLESRPRSYLSERKVDSEKGKVENMREEAKEKPGSKNLNNGPSSSLGSTTKAFELKRNDREKDDGKRNNIDLKINSSSDNSSSNKVKAFTLAKDDKKESDRVVSKPETKFQQTKQNTNTTLVNAQKSFSSKTERREEHRVAVGVGDTMEQVKHAVESKSIVQNGQKVMDTKTTTSRLSSSLDKFNSSDKTKAIGNIGRALGGARNMFLNADKASTGKPTEFGLNFTKKSDKPGYTVKKFTESKIEEKSTSIGKVEYGLSFQKKDTGLRTNLRETQPGSAFKKDSPSMQRRHMSAPAATGQAVNFKMPGGGSKASSVADRMRMFKESEEDEKARKEKQKQKEIKQRERLASDPTPVKSPASSTAPCVKKREIKKPLKRTMSISNIVLDWCKEMVKDYGIEIKNFSGSWSSGLAFCALIHKFNPDKFDFKELSENDRARNFRTAFDTAFEVKNIPKLLDVEDMVSMAKPEPRSVQCYVQWIWSVYGPTSGYGPSMEEIKQAQVA